MYTHTCTASIIYVQLSSKHRIPKVVSNGSKPLKNTGTVPVGMLRATREYNVHVLTIYIVNAAGTGKGLVW